MKLCNIMLLDSPMSRAALQKGNSLLSAAATFGTGQAYWIGAYLITKSPYVWAWRGLDQSASVLMNCGGSATDPPTVKGLWALEHSPGETRHAALQCLQMCYACSKRNTRCVACISFLLFLPPSA